MFEPFYRAGSPGSGHRGSGLGLAIARGFTEANAGSLHVESLPGQGASFVFELPLLEDSADVSVTARATASSRQPTALLMIERAGDGRVSAQPSRTPPLRRGCSSSTTSRRSCAR